MMSCWNCRGADYFDLRHRESASTAGPAAQHRKNLTRRWRRPGRRHKDRGVPRLNGAEPGLARPERSSGVRATDALPPEAICNRHDYFFTAVRHRLRRLARGLLAAEAPGRP